MLPHDAVGQWPPEVPPYRTPWTPAEPPAPTPAPPRTPGPMLPTWEEFEPPRQRDLADRLLDERIIVVSGDLDDQLANRTISQLLVLGRSRNPIELHLTCERSQLAAALTLADAIDVVRSPVRAVVRGVLRGPAIAVLCACERRVAHHNALFILSLPSTGISAGSAQEVVHLSQQLELQEEQLRNRIAAVTGRTDEQVAHDLGNGRFLTAIEAKEYGLVEEIV